MSLPHDGLAETVIRYVRSGKWKELKSGKDRSIYDYLCKNLDRREQMLARIRVNEELGDETPEELAVAKKKAQFEQYRVVHNATGQQGIVTSIEGDRATVNWFGDDLSEGTVVSTDEISFVDDHTYGNRQHLPIGTPIKFVHDPSKTGVISGYVNKFDAPDDGGDLVSENKYQVELDDGTPPMILDSSEFVPMWYEDDTETRNVSAYLKVGDEVIDSRYQVKGIVTDVKESRVSVDFSPFSNGPVAYSVDVKFLKKIDSNKDQDFVDELPSLWPQGGRLGTMEFGPPEIAGEGTIVHQTKELSAKPSQSDDASKSVISEESLKSDVLNDSSVLPGTYAIRLTGRGFNKEALPRSRMFSRIIGSYNKDGQNYFQVQYEDGEIEDIPANHWRLANPQEVREIRKWFAEVEQVEKSPSEFDEGDWISDGSDLYRVDSVLSDGRLSVYNDKGRDVLDPDDVSLARATEEHEKSWQQEGRFIYNAVSNAFERIEEVRHNYIYTTIVAPETDIDGKPSAINTARHKAEPVAEEQMREVWSKAKFEVGENFIAINDRGTSKTGTVLNNKLVTHANGLEPAYLVYYAGDFQPNVVSEFSMLQMIPMESLFDRGEEVYLSDGTIGKVAGSVDNHFHAENESFQQTVEVQKPDGSVESMSPMSDMEPTVSNMVTAIGGLDQFLDKHVSFTRDRIKVRTEPGLQSRESWLGSDEQKGFITDMRENAENNTIEVQLEGAGGRDRKRLSLTWESFHDLISGEMHTREEAYAESAYDVDPDMYLGDDTDHIERKPGSIFPANYTPDENGKFPVEKFVDFVEGSTRNPETYEAVIASNIDLAAKSFDSVLLQNAMKNKGNYLILQAAVENGNMDEEHAGYLAPRLLATRSKMFDNLNSGILKELYDRSTMKVQFASALDYNIHNDRQKKYLSDEDPNKAKVRAYQEILQRPETHALIQKHAKINDLGMLVFDKSLRIRRNDDGKYGNTNQRAIIGTLVSSASYVKQGKALKIIADQIPGDQPAPLKLKGLINTMLGYQIDDDGDLMRDENGNPVEAKDANGFSYVPTKEEANSKLDQNVTERLGRTLRRMGLSFDENGEPIANRASQIAEKYGMSYMNFSAYLEAMREDEEYKGMFEPDIIAALNDDEFGTPLKNIVSEALQVSPEYVWRNFTNGSGTVKPQDAAKAYMQGKVDYSQALWLSNREEIDEALLTEVSNSTGMEISEIASKIISGESISVDAFEVLVSPEKMKQLIASPRIINNMTSEEVMEAYDKGFFDEVHLSPAAMVTDNIQKISGALKAKVFDHIAENGIDSGVDEILDSITQPQIREEVSTGWRRNISTESVRNMGIMRLPFSERNTKAKEIRDLLLTKISGYSDEYQWLQESGSRFMPMATIFRPDGDLYRGMYRIPSDQEAKELDQKIQSAVKGVNADQMQYRMDAAMAGKNISKATKKALDLMHDTLEDNHQKKLLNAMYMMFSGEVEGGGSANETLKDAYRQLSENGFISDRTAQNFNHIFNIEIPQGNRQASEVADALVRNFMSQSSESEVSKMYDAIDEDAVSSIQSSMEKELIHQSLDSLKGKFRKPKRDEDGNIVTGEDGKPELEVDFTGFKNPKQFYKALKKSGLQLAGDETVEGKVQEVLKEIGVSPNYTEHKNNPKAMLLDQLRRVQEEEKLDDFFMRMFTPSIDGDESLFAALGRIKNLAGNEADDVDDKREQLSAMMNAMFVSSVLPPRSDNHVDGIAGYWPYETIVKRNFKGSPNSDTLGDEWLVENKIDWDKFFRDFDDVYAHLDEVERNHKRRVFEEVSKADTGAQRGTDGRWHNLRPWVRFDVFDVDYVDDDGSRRTVKKVSTREIQQDGLQNYMSEAEHPSTPSHLKSGDIVWVYDPDHVQEKINQFEDLTAKWKDQRTTDEEEPKLLEGFREVGREPRLKEVEVMKDNNGRPYYEHNGEKIEIYDIARPEASQSIYGELESRVDDYQKDPIVFKDLESQVQRRKPDGFEQEVINELTKIYNLVYRSLVRAAKAVDADEVMVLPSWTAKMKPQVLNRIGDVPPVDDALIEAFRLVTKEKDEKTGEQKKDFIGNEIWSSNKASQPLKDGYDNTAKAWGFSLSDIDHFYATDPYWGYGRQQLVNKMWKLDLTGKNEKSRKQLKKLNKRDAKRRRGLVTAQHSAAGASLAAFLKTYFEIQYRSGEIDFNKFAETLRDGYIQWRDMAAHQQYVRDSEVLEDAKRAASAELGIDLTGIDSPEWAYQQIDQEAYDRLLEQAQAPVEGSDDIPDPSELAAKLDSVLEAIMPNMYSHPEYSHLDSLDVPTAVARDVLMYDHVNFPQDVVREDPEYRKRVLDLVRAFEIRPDEVTDDGVEATWQDPVPEDGGVAGGDVSQASFYAGEAASFMNAERDDSYDAFIRWMDAEAPELHSNDELRSEVEQELRNRGKLVRDPSESDVPTPEELEQMFRRDAREASSEFRKGDKVVVRYCVVPQVRCQALAKKRARAKVHAVTNAGYVLEFDDIYDQKVLNRQLWLFTDLHLQPASGVSNG